jgi:hypothetical protein
MQGERRGEKEKKKKRGHLILRAGADSFPYGDRPALALRRHPRRRHRHASSHYTNPRDFNSGPFPPGGSSQTASTAQDLLAQEPVDAQDRAQRTASEPHRKGAEGRGHASLGLLLKGLSDPDPKPGSEPKPGGIRSCSTTSQHVPSSIYCVFYTAKRSLGPGLFCSRILHVGMFLPFSLSILPTWLQHGRFCSEL